MVPWRMKHVHRQLAALAVTGLVAATACEQGGTSGHGGAGGAPVTQGSTGSGATGGCGGTSEAFGACTNGVSPEGGTVEPGAACVTDTDCKPACCPCPHGTTLYAYAACSCGKCASVCNPSNDYRAPVCLDAGSTVNVGCLHCAQILGEALADGDQLGILACQGAASASWAALSACVTASCGTACPTVMPTSACATCLDETDGGCGAAVNGCLAD